MSGFEACWIPGTDHAGIATQTVVEKTLMKESGKTRDEIGSKFVLKHGMKINGNTIIEQLKKIGSSCDWQIRSGLPWMKAYLMLLKKYL